MRHDKFEDWKPSDLKCDWVIEIAQDPAGYVERHPNLNPMFESGAVEALTDPNVQLMNEVLAMVERIDRQMNTDHAAGVPEAALRALHEAKCRTLDTYEAMCDAQDARRAAARSTDKQAAR